VVLAFFLLTACTSNALFDENLAVDQQGWESRQMARFEVDVADTTANYAFYINIRHMEDYRFSNLYVFLHTRFPNGTQTKDTIECVLAKPDGEWLGKGTGSIRENTILLNPALRFPVAGKYVFEIEQAMREEKLNGIHDIGLRIVKDNE